MNFAMRKIKVRLACVGVILGICGMVFHAPAATNATVAVSARNHWAFVPPVKGSLPPV